jgi:hypothetical protein
MKPQRFGAGRTGRLESLADDEQAIMCCCSDKNKPL